MTPNASWDQCKALVEKHTDGPWLRIDKADYAEIHAAFRPSSAAVALVGRPSDADLIAAAPELLEALVRIDDMWSDDGDGGRVHPDDARSPQVREIWHSIRAALAKARGQS